MEHLGFPCHLIACLKVAQRVLCDSYQGKKKKKHLGFPCHLIASFSVAHRVMRDSAIIGRGR